MLELMCELAYRDGVEVESVEGLLCDVVPAQAVLKAQVEPDSYIKHIQFWLFSRLR